MGTRARVEIMGEGHREKEVLLSIYVHYDGYPTGLGADLGKILSRDKMDDGAGPGSFNGLGDLAAKVLFYLKQSSGDAAGDAETPIDGGVYVEFPMRVPGEAGEEYIYRIWVRENVIHISVNGGDMTMFGAANDPKSFKNLFRGDIDAYKEWLKSEAAA